MTDASSSSFTLRFGRWSRSREETSRVGIEGMPEFREELAQSFIVRAHFDCGGELERDGDAMKLSSPPQIGYRCPSCGARESLTEFYPKVVSRPAGAN
ncbi:hypothetical protein JYP51_21370 [Ponticoccus gilvus]|nr:hypothetical protein [Enemella evansiae]